MTTKELYAKAHEGYYNDKASEFIADVETVFEFNRFKSATLKQKIHSVAYERGHAYGYGDIITQYYDLIDVAFLAIDEAKRA